MYKIIIFIYLISVSLNASELKSLHHLPYKSAESLLQSIQGDAIYYGNGEKRVYVFLDPLCKYSRKFISTVAKNSKMLSKYRYYIYLYGIPRLHSSNAISAIYMSQNRIKTLLDIMIKKHTYSAIADTLTHNRVNRIALVAEKVGVNKRPFLMIEK